MESQGLVKITNPYHRIEKGDGTEGRLVLSFIVFYSVKSVPGNAPSMGWSAIQAADQALLTSFDVLIAAARSSASANSAGTDDVGK